MDFFEFVKNIDSDLATEKSFDLIKRELKIAERKAFLYFTDGFIKDEVYEKILEFLYKLTPEELKKTPDMTEFAKNKMPYVEVEASYDIKQIETAILSGPSVLLIEGVNGALIVDTRTYPMRGIEEPQKDKSLRGSRDGFVEALVMNTALLRRRIRDNNMRMEYMQIGSDTKLDIAIAYLENKADKRVLKILKEKLKDMQIEGISMTGQAVAEKLQKTSFFNPFPKFKTTERPDYASACIFDGRIVLLLDNSPSVIILPISLSDFFRETDDYYFSPIVGTYTRIVRMLVAIANVLLTPIYLLLVNSPNLVPDWLEFMLPDKKFAIPLILQFLILEFLVDGLRLASLNTPDALSSPLGIVGGLLLSEFAINAGWFITEAILFMAFVTIAGFSLPNYEMGYAMKLERLLLLVLVSLFGIYGLIGGIVFLIIAMLSVKTLSGRNYLYPIVPFNLKGFIELFIRFPIK